MGFDLHTLTEPTELPDGFDPQDPESPGWWGDGWAGIGAFVEVMTLAGVIDHDMRRPKFPNRPDGIDDERAGELNDLFNDGLDLKKIAGRPDADELRRYGEYRRECARLLATPSPVPGQVPAFKWSDNGGWHVTADECRLIADALAAMLAGPDADALSVPMIPLGYDLDFARSHVRQWMLYHRIAATCGGYQVG